MKKLWTVTFSYSKSGRREFLCKDFELDEGEDIDKCILNYLHSQNAGEPKSDRITFRAKKYVLQSK